MPNDFDWYEGLLASVKGAAERAAQRSAERTNRNRTSQRNDAIRSVGSVERVSERGDGWFRAPKLSDSDFERLTDGVLALDDHVMTQQFSVLETTIDDGRSFVRIQVAAPETGLKLFLPQMDPARIYKGLYRGLEKYRSSQMAERFSTRTLTPISTGSIMQPQDPPAVAISALLAPGLHVVWGPPGTGKTRVIVKSFKNLIANGKRCLLVSNTNIAVDNALERLLAEMPLESGSAVRVGRPQIPELTNRHITLTELVRARQTAIWKEIAQLENEMLRLKAAPAVRAVSQAFSRLEGFDLAAYAASRKRLGNAEDLSHAQSVKQAWESHVADACGQVADAERNVRLTQLLIAEADVTHWVQRRDDLAAEASNLKGSLFSRRKRSRLRQAIAEAELRLNDALRVRHDVQVDRVRHADPLPVGSTQSREALKVQISRQRDDVARYEREVADRAQGLANSKGWMDHLARQPAPTPLDAPYCIDADQRGLPALAAELPKLRRLAQLESDSLQKMREHLESKVARAHDEQPALEASILKESKVVATTVAQLILKPSLASLQFDMVVVDEAAAVALPQIVLAASHADEGCSLLGDYMQNGPIIADDLTSDEYWNIDVFEYFGLTSPVSARQTPGCVVLDQQYRFGQAITDFANAIAYQNVLGTAREIKSNVVLVDVDGLPNELTRITRRPGKRAGSWPVGGQLARALAEIHCGLGKTVGVVVPYNDQLEATDAALGESVYYERIAVGTAYKFQGREFDVVIFDTVDDGMGQVAVAVPNAPPADRLRKWKRNGVRLANVAVTRARETAYIIAGGAVLAGKAADTPLGALRILCERNVAQTVSAASILALSEEAE